MTWDDEQEYSAMKSYHAFLVRCWGESNDAAQELVDWRFSVTLIGSSPEAPRGFASLDALTAFISKQILGSAPLENPSSDESADLSKGL